MGYIPGKPPLPPPGCDHRRLTGEEEGDFPPVKTERDFDHVALRSLFVCLSPDEKDQFQALMHPDPLPSTYELALRNRANLIGWKINTGAADAATVDQLVTAMMTNDALAAEKIVVAKPAAVRELFLWRDRQRGSDPAKPGVPWDLLWFESVRSFLTHVGHVSDGAREVVDIAMQWSRSQPARMRDMTEVDERQALANADDARLVRLRDRKVLRTVGLIFGAAVGAGIAGTLIAIFL